MTTTELLQRYPPHSDSIHKGKAPDKPKAFNGKKPDPIFEANNMFLHDMLDRVVKGLANSQSEPASEFEGTLWRSPLRPRSRSPAYSDISESFESPARIEHCTKDLLSTPMSPTSAQFKGPDGWPLGIEVAIDDFYRGRLSTPVLEEKELPNPLILRKQRQQTPCFGSKGNREGQRTASLESVASRPLGDGQYQHESGGLKSLAFQKQQSSVQSQKCGERQDIVSFSPLSSQQHSSTRLQQEGDRQDRQESVDIDSPEMQEPSDEEIDLESVCIPTLSPRKYVEDQNSLGNASSELHPTLAHDKVPIGLGSENARRQPSTSRFYSEEHDGSHTQIHATCLLHNSSRQTALSEPPPRNKTTHDDAHQAEPRINALANALEETIKASKILGAFENTAVESINREVGCQDVLEDTENNTLQAIGQLTSDDSKVDTDSEIVSWKASGPLEDILEEDQFISTSTLGEGQPYFAVGSSRAGEKRDSMLALEGAQTETSNLLSSSPRVLPMLKLTIDPTSEPQFESTIPSRHSRIHAYSSESVLTAATMAELKDPTRRKGSLSAAALAEMRKIAESQPHFQTEHHPLEDQSQANIHPLLRSQSFTHPWCRPNKMVNESPLKYVFEDDDSESHDDDERENIAPQLVTKPHPTEASDMEDFTTQVAEKRHQSFQLGKMMEDTVPKYLCNDGDTEGHKAEYAGTFIPQMSTLRSSDNTTLVPSLENATPTSNSSSTTSRSSASGVESPDVMPSSVFQPSNSSSTTGYYPSSAIGLPAAYNSWASTPHHHEHGNTSRTPSSATTTLPTSTIPTPNTLFHGGIRMTPSSSSGQLAGNLPISRESTTTPSSLFGQLAGNRTYRRSISVSSMFARYHKARYPDLPTAAMTDSILSSKDFAKRDQASEVTHDPFTSPHDTTTTFSWNLKAPSKETLANTPIIGVDQFNTPTKRSASRFSRHRRSLSTSGHSNVNEGIERALSTMIFHPRRSRPHKRSHSISASVDITVTTVMPNGSGPGHRRSLSIATTTVEQKWEIAPPPTPLGLRDEFSMRYRPEPLEADDHYTRRQDAFQGMKQGLKKVFGRT
ncbi:MAG: hypothetical protein ALECFALPRED_000876 [Alectoria fallacina]|uniref:Uncharacterized protein n=1 Tax=Alectoria fallacina TaxID=1903189 RepID=A0A8H3FB90_9LECA|nr:MAG: hypothetical protein ALECFALPRED_000876 [Alectoria fallacina]